ncbi:MAG: AAA family ATPase [Patescibacteria group bacterium]
MRISIVGLAGSGKTTLAQEISKKLKIPHVQLDQFWFEEGGNKIDKRTPPADKERIRKSVRDRVLKETSKSSWVSDGFYSRIQPEIAERVDILIFLDVSLWKRLLNHGRRILKQDGYRKSSVWSEITFFPEIIKRQFEYSPKLKIIIDKYKDKVVVFKSNKEIQEYLKTLR